MVPREAVKDLIARYERYFGRHEKYAAQHAL
jgi:hypothetical protein